MRSLPRPRTIIALAVGATLLAIGCTASISEPPGVPPGAEPVAFRALDGSVPIRWHSGLSERARLVVRSQDAWTALWAEMARHVSPMPPAPLVDFEREMLIVAAMGTRPSGGYVIEIESVHRHEGRLIATVREDSPGRCLVTAALTAPVTIVAVPRGDEELSTIERARTYHCE